MNIESTHLQQYTFTKNGYISNFEMIVGHSNVINAGIDLLKCLPKKPDYINESVLITFLTELDSFSNFENVQQEWCSALFSAQEKGWNIIKLMNINENISRNMKIINEVLLNIISKNYQPCYFNKYDSILSFREFIILPSVGTLFCICSGNTNKIDTAILIRDEQASKALTGAFDLCVKHTKPLITNRYNVQNADFLTEIANYEELSGDRYTLNFCLNYLTIPPELIENFSLSDKKRFSKELINIKKLKELSIVKLKITNFLIFIRKISLKTLLK